MRKHSRVALIGLMLVLAGTIGTVALGHSAVETRVYSVAQVQVGRRADPHAWAGRTLLVRGGLISFAWGCGLGPGGGCQTHWEDLQPLVTCPHPSPLHGCEFAPLPALPSPLIVRRGPHFVVPDARPADPMRRLLGDLAGLPVVGRFVPPAAWRPDETLYRVRLVRLTPCPSPPAGQPCVDAILL